jgi:hypothetical protein
MATSVHAFFENYAAGLLSFSAETIAGFYQTPLAVYADQGIRLVNEMSEVVAFWEEGVKPYQAQEIVKANPSILSEEQLSEKIFASKVRWNNYDSSGKEVAVETNFYLLTRTEERLKICGLVIMEG